MESWQFETPTRETKGVPRNEGQGCWAVNVESPEQACKKKTKLISYLMCLNVFRDVYFFKKLRDNLVLRHGKQNKNWKIKPKLQKIKPKKKIVQ